ncbi:MAG: PSD1 domain-containing protein [Planctomycetia bacterium]|nr:PSD1 domain-containing protein [Planctomycetia bacterium]
MPPLPWLKKLPAVCALAVGLAVAYQDRDGVAAAEPDAKGIEFFENKIRPVLVNSCYECHSAKSSKVKGGLLLDTRDGVRNGGDTGPAIIPGDPDKSLLIQSLRHDKLQMPPKNKLPENVIADFVQWVKLGAPDPRDAAGNAAYKRLSLEEARSFWSFVPAKKPEAPKVQNASWPRGDIDRFVLARLEAKGLRPVADAERATLLRRVHFDLLGLPPTPEDVEAFLKDASPTAFEKVVDRLLQSPQFGERWGRHWLDVARYAESNGNADNTPFPHAWRYRDYVIASLNRDKPYDRFVTEQIAGDLLPTDNPTQRDELLIATGFLALTSKPRAQNNPDYKMDLIADQIDVTSRAVLGLSVMCARCHDHKFDPISTKEYYSLAGIFDSTTMLAGGGGKGGGNKGGDGGGLHALSDGGSAMGVRDGKAVDSAVCIRGESTKRGETVPRGFLAVATVGEAPAINRAQSGRLELARWLTSPQNPLTARVAVNRAWLHLFGQGLVRSVDNFGSLGEKPSHPELLDFLALRFVEEGWSVKKLIRGIVLSRTYQLSSSHDAANLKADPDNLLLWRMQPRRLDAESIRDAILSVSGRLDLKPPQGSSAATVPAKGAKGGNAPPKDSGQHRSVYLGVPRGAPLPESLAVFDVANPNLSVSQREVTTVPAQALFLLNSPFVMEQAKLTAQRLLAAPNLDDAGRVALAYRLAFARTATDAERTRALNYIAQMTQAGRDKNGAQNAWASFCQALFASAEFRYLE